VRVDGVQPLVDLADAVRVGMAGFFRQQRRALGIGGKHGLERRRLAGRSLLRDIADARAPRHLHPAVVGIELAGDDLHQRRLAGPVAADQPDPRARRDRRRRTVENDAPAEAHRDGVDGQHVCRDSMRQRVWLLTLCAYLVNNFHFSIVIPAQAGTQTFNGDGLGSRLRGNDDEGGSSYFQNFLTKQ